MVILGVILYYALGVALSFLLKATNSLAAIVAVIAANVVFMVLIIVYAIYSSLFTNALKLRSSAVASFLNGFAGGIVFGPLWCKSLTKKRRGVSQYVLLGLLVAGLIGVVVLFVLGYSGVSLDGIRTQPSSPYTKAELVQIASTEDGVTSKTREVLERNMSYIDGDDNADTLERIRFGSL